MAKKKNAKKSVVKKTPAKPASATDTINNEVIAAALSVAQTPVLLKVCRLCEAKDGPFLNIFEADKMTAKKIETVMPFAIAENDDLPHKICFRCSAKLEELYEFIQKCIKTQENLRKALGNRGGVAKSRHIEIWEEKLNQSNISNDDICEAVIKKAMEGIRDIPKNPLPLIEEIAPGGKKVTKKLPAKSKEEKAQEQKVDEDKKQNEVSSKNEKSVIFDCKDDEPISILKNALQNDAHDDDDDEPPVKRQTRLKEKKVELSESKLNKTKEKRETSKPIKKDKHEAVIKEQSVVKEIGLKIKQSLQTNNFSLEESPKVEPPKVEPPKQPEPKPFDIMEHVSMIKVNGVGVLFQCKLCNRNFLKKEVVMFHACAKQGATKVQNSKTFLPPEPPKIPQTVKYITMNKDASKPGVSVDNSKSLENQKTTVSEPITLDDDDDDKPLTVKKPAKPKIGPASKVRRSDTNTTTVASEPTVKSTSNQHAVAPTQLNPMQIVPNITATITSPNLAPSVQFPSIPSLNSRYKLMPGPNNSFTLVEDKSDVPTYQANQPIQPQANTLPFTVTESNIQNSNVKRYEKQIPMAPTDPSISRPYPVGLITAAGSRPPLPEPPAFPTPAMKKQSYTVVQTGNPSKLLISTKPQPPPPVENVPRKRSRKSKNAAVEDKTNEQPFSVTLEDATPPTDPRIFTFVNVDPLLQPSYVLPTDNIIQESQISTSTNVLKQTVDKDSKYTCNMCNEKFSREKKLLAHIQSHYKQMDEEDEKRAGNNSRKRGRK